ncbi:Acyl-CoA thioesterase (modular protein) [Frankia canadensis]|uniref:Acyl-CoA thioesterase (Modular protein) n=1 Tax=Frankia canadensis TaxID=1836972 RepID=A0A2I2KK11_9ACTN|nr:acyl-CoA thioesterase domain-containing protein [Frankia canadensis]SNQ45987.1 Acyl-CoA thioesterase (modular protein) [Frankia canadensis]SOU53277.1 Acyl-CoA thioesterase (modular protein) [Frankia canadensis]
MTGSSEAGTAAGIVHDAATRTGGGKAVRTVAGEPAAAPAAPSGGAAPHPRRESPVGAGRVCGGPSPSEAASITQLLGLTVDPVRRRGRFVAADHLLNTRGTLWGGCGLAAAMEFVRVCGGRDGVWAQTQFLAPVEAGRTVDLEIDPAGRGLSQAVVRATVEGRPVFVTSGTFGRGGGDVTRFAPPAHWAPAPEDCPPREYPTWLDYRDDGLVSLLDQRWARPARVDLDGTPGTGRSALWLRLRPPLAPAGAALAVLGDLAPAALIEAIGDMAFGTSLDNHLRLVAPACGPAVLPAGEWILLDVRVEGIVRNVAHLGGRMYAGDGTLIAVTGQSVLVHRVRPPERGGVDRAARSRLSG